MIHWEKKWNLKFEEIWRKIVYFFRFPRSGQNSSRLAHEGRCWEARENHMSCVAWAGQSLTRSTICWPRSLTLPKHGLAEWVRLLTVIVRARQSTIYVSCVAWSTISQWQAKGLCDRKNYLMRCDDTLARLKVAALAWWVRLLSIRTIELVLKPNSISLNMKH